MNPDGLLIFGFGGHARSIADVALDLGIRNLAFVDRTARPNETLFGFAVQTDLPDRCPDRWSAFPAAGDNTDRQRQIEQIAARSLILGSLISRKAYVGKGSTILPGSFVAHQANIGPMCTIGRGTIINTAAVVDHESSIGDFSHISVNSTVTGRCKIGNMVFLGAGSTVIDGIHICDGAVIGAGSVVVKDITEAGIYVGAPARRLAKACHNQDTDL